MADDTRHAEGGAEVLAEGPTHVVLIGERFLLVPTGIRVGEVWKPKVAEVGRTGVGAVAGVVAIASDSLMAVISAVEFSLLGAAFNSPLEEASADVGCVCVLKGSVAVASVNGKRPLLPAEETLNRSIVPGVTLLAR